MLRTGERNLWIVPLQRGHTGSPVRAFTYSANRVWNAVVNANPVRLAQLRAARPSGPSVAICRANGPDGARLFVQMLSVGFDAHVVHNMPFPMKNLFGKGACVMQSMRELCRYKFPVIRMRIDEAETEAASVIISKGCLYGGRFRLASDAMPGEPEFSVVLFDRSGPAATMIYGAALPLNLLGSTPGVRHIRARRIEFVQNVVVPAQTDGDSAGFAPLWVSDAPGPIQVVVG